MVCVLLGKTRRVYRQRCEIIMIIIIIMEICKAPTLRLKALNKHSMTRVMYIEMEMVSAVRESDRQTDRQTERS